jgi:O-antigen/teichoic acid export membrane protein
LREKLRAKERTVFGNLIHQMSRLVDSPVAKYSTVNGVTKLVPILVSIVLASLLAPSEYGLVALVVVVSSVFSSLTNYGFGVMVARESHVRTKQEFGELMSSSWVVSFIMFSLLLSVVMLFRQSLGWVGLQKEWLVCGVVLGFLLGRIDVYSKYLVAQQKVRDYSILELCKGAGTALISVVLVYAFLDHAVLARITGLLVGTAVAFVLAHYIVRKRIVYLRPTKTNINQIFSYGTKVLPQAIANWIKLGADKVVIGSLIGLEALGAYSFTFSVCAMFMVFGVAFNNAFIGPSMSMYKSGDVEGVANLRSRYIAVATVLVIACSFGVMLLPLVYWPEGYTISRTAIGLLMFSFWAQVIYLLYAKYFIFSLKMSELSYVNLSATVVYVLGLILVKPGELEYVAICFFSYNCFLAIYAMVRVTYEEKKLVRVEV